MSKTPINRRSTLLLGTCLLAGAWALAGSAAAEEPKELNVYNWSDYIGETTIEDFEKETGIKVTYDMYTGNEDLEAKLVIGGTGYDVVFPSSSFFARQIQIGLYQKLDKSKLPNLKNLDPGIMAILSKEADPGNEHAIPYMWGTNGFTYNVKMIEERMPDAPVDSLAMIFDPEIASKFADCGITFLDSPEDVIPLALAYMGKDPTSQKEEDIIAAADMVMKVRPFIRQFDSQQYLNALPNGENCISMSWSGDYATAAGRAAEAGIDIELAYTIPKEGTNIWFDGMLIPADAPHPGNAHLFLDYMMRPEVIAAATNYTYYANANVPAKQYVLPEILEDPAIYPDEETLKRGFPSVVRDQALSRVITREWTRIKTGQ
ncbi:putrescine transport system substrate-binding protein [Dongia mobilis]|uniref:Putrescine-binding periplasmic protein n=1 Tax=Dongia mobilis TaxID=578943 RepID=A0A4R6WKB4_9PROT|nr:polyamine ABC transporter substrate-binding protein [Dongia mobilis]TDQ80993.1 putrescine transport system substrate-binding protein [Dongia mobilis]